MPRRQGRLPCRTGPVPAAQRMISALPGAGPTSAQHQPPPLQYSESACRSAKAFVRTGAMPRLSLGTIIQRQTHHDTRHPASPRTAVPAWNPVAPATGLAFGLLLVPVHTGRCHAACGSGPAAGNTKRRCWHPFALHRATPAGLTCPGRFCTGRCRTALLQPGIISARTALSRTVPRRTGRIRPALARRDQSGHRRNDSRHHNPTGSPCRWYRCAPPHHHPVGLTDRQCPPGSTAAARQPEGCRPATRPDQRGRLQEQDTARRGHRTAGHLHPGRRRAAGRGSAPAQVPVRQEISQTGRPAFCRAGTGRFVLSQILSGRPRLRHTTGKTGRTAPARAHRLRSGFSGDCHRLGRCRHRKTAENHSDTAGRSRRRSNGRNIRNAGPARTTGAAACAGTTGNARNARTARLAGSQPVRLSLWHTIQQPVCRPGWRIRAGAGMAAGRGRAARTRYFPGYLPQRPRLRRLSGRQCRCGPDPGCSHGHCSHCNPRRRTGRQRLDPQRPLHRHAVHPPENHLAQCRKGCAAHRNRPGRFGHSVPAR